MIMRWIPAHGKLTLMLLSGLLVMGCSKNESEPTAPPIPPAAAPAAAIQPALQDAEPLQDHAATAALVNGEPITVAEVRALFDDRVGPYRHQIPPEQMDAFWQAQLPGLLEMAIAQRLVKAAIQKQQIVASDADIDAMLETFISRIPPDQSIEEITGQTRDEIRRDIGDMLAFERLMENAGLTKPEPTDEQIQDYYNDNAEQFRTPETVQARHILLQVEDPADTAEREAKRSQIDALREQLLEGADFAELAAEHSDCPSRQRGGDLGAFGRGQMVGPFEEAAFTQELEAIGPVVETEFGYHIIQVTQRETAREVPLDEAREYIVNHLQNEVRRAQSDQTVKQLRAAADIQYLLP